MNRIITVLVFLAILTPNLDLSAASVFEKFKISTASADVYEHTESSLKLESQSPTYQIKLEPNEKGSIMFTLGRYGYRSTLQVKDLAFGVKIEGFKGGEIVHPSFNLDDSYDNIHIDQNVVVFQWIHDPVPVFFRTSVDSIKLHFSNSYGLDVHQYLSLDDLEVIKSKKVKRNPLLKDCQKNSIMFAVEGSSSIDKGERKTIARQLLDFSKTPSVTQDSNAVCIMEFGKKVDAISESIVKKDIVKNIKSYKKGKNGHKSNSAYANWEAALDEAIVRRPDIFILIADRWTNYSNEGPASFNAQFNTLIQKCNKVKSQGTRLLFITSGLQTDKDSNPVLYSMLNKQRTNEISGQDLLEDIDLSRVDLISMEDIGSLELIDLVTLLHCNNGLAAE